jgi:hypothetical protein
MKKNFTLTFLIAPAVIALFFAGTLYHNGSPGGKSGSPGDNNATCTQCHSGTPVAVDGWITSNIPALGYVVGETYTITATGTHNGVGRFGFELTAEDSNGNKVGQFTIINSETQLTNSNHAVTHTNAGITPQNNAKTWTLNWTAPATDVGLITFYGAFNAANNNGGTSGDVVYKSTLAVDESSVGTNNQEIVEKLIISPNPANNNVRFFLGSETGSISVVDMTGKLVLYNDDYKSGDDINISTIRNGVYMITFANETKRLTQKMVKK